MPGSGPPPSTLSFRQTDCSPKVDLNFKGFANTLESTSRREAEHDRRSARERARGYYHHNGENGRCSSHYSSADSEDWLARGRAERRICIRQGLCVHRGDVSINEMPVKGRIAQNDARLIFWLTTHRSSRL